MVLIAALLADQLYRLLRDRGCASPTEPQPGSPRCSASRCWAFSDEIYPELPGALLVVACLRIMVVGASSPAALALGSAAAAALVWLHVRYVALSLAAVGGLAIAACAARWDGAEPPHGGRIVRRFRAVGETVVGYAVTGIRNWRTVALPVAVPYVVVLGLLAVTFKHLYGSPNPLAPYHAYSSANVGSAGWRSLYDFTLENLLSPSGGWIPFAPVQWLGLAALGCLVYWFGWRAAAFVGAAVAYLLLVASGNPGFGWGLPARYPMIVIPLVAIPIALLLQHVRASRFLFVPLLAVSILFAFSAMKDFQGLYPLGDKARMFGLRKPPWPTRGTATCRPHSFSILVRRLTRPATYAARHLSRKRGATERAISSGARTLLSTKAPTARHFGSELLVSPTKSLWRGSRWSAACRQGSSRRKC